MTGTAATFPAGIVPGCIMETVTTNHKQGVYGLQARMENHLLAKAATLFEGLEESTRSADVETLHRLRITSRRLRVGLRLFAEVFPSTERRQACRHLRRLTRALGEVRTLDVNLQLLRAARRRLAPETRDVQVQATRMLLAERAEKLKALRELAALLVASRFAARLEKMIRHTDRRLDSKRLLKSVREEVERLRGVARQRFKRWEDKKNRRAFHRLRIAVKKYRYALESSGAVFGMPGKSRVDAVEDLQDLMGACHDVEILLEWLESAKLDKSLARQVEWVSGCLREDYDQHRRAAVEFLKKERRWAKKVRLELNHE